jgi:serine/threonine protein kinase
VLAFDAGWAEPSVERWQQIELLFQEALQRDPAERDAYVREACRGDSDLRREVASLLANHREVSDFKPWAASAAAQLISGQASLQAGQFLGPYEILAPIGAGGMGEVYKARDTRLKRDVAIKICAAQFSERFEREARAIASLNHPNICQLYDVGPNCLVMELVEGENLSGPLPVETALNYARQIAEALEAAHEKGIVHRDLKPANVKITPAGVVKVLDFGLAKAAEEPSPTIDQSQSPTMTMSPTRAGLILGTAPYMAPEQARGKPVDKRADIWAFGCVLYEMLSGKQAFHGETTSDILAAVLRAEPDWSALPALTPMRIRRLLRRCLERDHKQRLQAIGEARIAIDTPEEEVTPRAAPLRLWPWAAAAVLATALAIIAAIGWWRATRSVPLRPSVRLSVELPPDTAFPTISGRGPQLALSPDGTRLAVIVRGGDGKIRIATRRFDQSEFATLSGTEGASAPFFSPDGQWIGFFADGKLKKIAIQGGSSVTLCDAPNVLGASWGDDGNIIAALNREGGLSRVSSGGGAPTAVMEPDKNIREAIGWPQVLPGSQMVLVASVSVVGGSFDDANIEILSFKTGKRKTVLRGGFFGRYLATSSGTGYLVYMHQNMLFAAPFDLGRLAVTGASQPVLEDVSSVNRYGTANFDFSGAPSGPGSFVYISSTGQSPWLIYWLDSLGNTEPVISIPGYYWTPRVSPDGNSLAYAMGSSPAGGSDLWVKDLKRDAASRLTSLPGWNYWPVWTPDSKNIVFAWVGSVARGLYWIRADSSGEP